MAIDEGDRKARQDNDNEHAYRQTASSDLTGTRSTEEGGPRSPSPDQYI